MNTLDAAKLSYGTTNENDVVSADSEALTEEGKGTATPRAVQALASDETARL